MISKYLRTKGYLPNSFSLEQVDARVPGDIFSVKASIVSILIVSRRQFEEDCNISDTTQAIDANVLTVGNIANSKDSILANVRETSVERTYIVLRSNFVPTKLL